MKTTLILAGLITLGAPGAFAQGRPISCEEARDRALTRVTIVSNSRVLMEEDLATLSVTLRKVQRRLAQVNNQVQLLKEQLAAKETEATEAETEAGESETPKAPTDVRAGAKGQGGAETPPEAQEGAQEGPDRREPTQ